MILGFKVDKTIAKTMNHQCKHPESRFHPPHTEQNLCCCRTQGAILQKETCFVEKKDLLETLREVGYKSQKKSKKQSTLFYYFYWFAKKTLECFHFEMNSNLSNQSMAKVIISTTLHCLPIVIDHSQSLQKTTSSFFWQYRCFQQIVS